MTDTTGIKPSPVKVQLTKEHIAVTGIVLHEDRSTYPLVIYSLSMRGAQQEVTRYLTDQGYTPYARWRTISATTTMRLFK